ncbi:MAG TPA: cyclase family protein [Candidatus Caldiarchaeum subterraneum]|uniref:Cyclase family protein n=1 Tax=Caldiarchaeum subterraneum TaxID=311458 RepID=A0A832ZXJ8_CALS0|nr:cyclase family protein [Aigarchaeota archaeon]HIQ30187.1 cyclase family protein [Candidatus Caldarchaeum subterraneum]
MWILLSHKLDIHTPSYNLGPGLEIRPYKLIARGDSSSSYIIQLYNHLGTHVDAPRHFDEKGRAVADYSPGELVFTRPRLVDIPKGVDEPITAEEMRRIRDGILDADLLMIRTGIQRIRETEVEAFSREGPYLTPEAARFIADELPHLRALGIDAVSISSPKHREEGRESHRTLLKDRDFLIIEDMNLKDKPANIKQVILSPLMVIGVDSSPCVVWAEI